jgi:DNA-binding NtrC family response regulator
MKRVVVLDRDPEVERLATEIRDTHDVQVNVAHDAREAEEQISRGDVALVVVDMETPRHSGEKLLAWMEKRHIETPVVIGVEAGDSSRLLGEFPDIVKIFEPKPIALRALGEMVALYAE